MLLGKGRRAISSTAFVLMVLVVIVVGGAIGISYPKAGHGVPGNITTSTTTPSSSSTTTSTSSSSTTSTATTSSTASTSTASTSATFATHTATPPLANFGLAAYPLTMLGAPGGNYTYPVLSIIPLPSALQGAGNLDVGDELVALNATAAPGLSFRFFGSDVVNTYYMEISIVGSSSEEMNIAIAPGTPAGDYPVTVTGSSGSYHTSVTFNVKVTPNLVIGYDNAFAPGNLTVKAGSTVYWLNLQNDGPDSYYDVTFTNINVASPSLDGQLFDSWSYTFNTPGTFTYYSTTVGKTMAGEVVVTS
ncbi:MAG TPA: hypothetical protein VLX56_03490 [Nitrososphaerales archaeon]|nr:hypothetical protein [Nitrososphaerales archaeon]